MAHHWRRKHDPLTFRYARYPHESATPADYAKSIEPPDEYETDIWLTLATAVSVISICFVIGIVIFEKVTK
jgi:hypothetical protein